MRERLGKMVGRDDLERHDKWLTAASTYMLKLPGAVLQRGFWLYVWRVESPPWELLYVGRTGDNSSPNAKPPYQRMGPESPATAEER